MRFFLVPIVSLTVLWGTAFLFEPSEPVAWFMLGLMLSTVYCIGDAHGRSVEYKRCNDIVKYHVDKIQTILDEQISNNQTAKE